jgi:hypothetical protein
MITGDWGEGRKKVGEEGVLILFLFAFKLWSHMCLILRIGNKIGYETSSVDIKSKLCSTHFYEGEKIANP